WSGVRQQEIVIDWTVIHDEGAAKDFSAQIMQAARAFRDRTSIGGGIDFAMAQRARAPFHAHRHTTDVSGDDIHNDGRAAYGLTAASRTTFCYGSFGPSYREGFDEQVCRQ